MDWSQLNWAQADRLWLLPAVLGPLAIGYAAHFAWKARVRRSLGTGRHARRLMAGVSPAKATIKALLTIVGTALLLLALLRPQYGMREVELAHSGIDIAVVLDASKSMLVQDVVPNRLGGAILEVSQLLDRLQGGRVALIPFAGMPFVQSPLTSDFEVIKLYLRDLRVQDMPVGGTAIGRALDEALRMLAGGNKTETTDTAAGPSAAVKQDQEQPEVEPLAGSRYKAIVLLTDGEENVAEASDLVQRAKERGVRVFAVGVGTRAGRPIPIVQEDGSVTGVMKEKDGVTPKFSALNETFLQQLAEATGGEYFGYSGRSIAATLYARIEQLEKKEFEESMRQLGEDRFPFVLLPAILVLLAEMFLSERRRRSVEASS